jgi:hypothetical protein
VAYTVSPTTTTLKKGRDLDQSLFILRTEIRKKNGEKIKIKYTWKY